MKTVGISVGEALGRLNHAVESGALAQTCRRFDVEIVTLFGSAVSSAAPRDIDIAIGFAPGSPRDILGVIDAVNGLVPGDHLDVMDLDRAGPVAQKAAMFTSRVLFAAHPSVTTEREIRAYMTYEDTRWLRDLQTEMLRR
ncbi:MAG: hypothetical protein Q4G43_11910 [Mobilicoccus sp.]|nr:hypothetical protein [Mobilicoccus sp.]